MSTYVAPASDVEGECADFDSFRYEPSDEPIDGFRPGWCYVRDLGEDGANVIAGPFVSEANADRWIAENIEGAMPESEWEAQYGD